MGESLKGHISACHTPLFVFTAIVSIKWRSSQAKIELALKQILKSEKFGGNLHISDAHPHFFLN